MAYQTVLFEKERHDTGTLGLITLNRPEVRSPSICR